MGRLALSLGTEHKAARLGYYERAHHMSDLLEGILSELGSGGISEIANGLGIDQSTASSAVGLALPAILGGMANNAQKAEGAQSLSNALDDHDAGIFGQLGDLLGGGGPGEGILGHVLGQKQPAVEQNLSQQSGLNLGSIAKLLPILAPLVMGYLSKQKKANDMGAADIGSMLGRERQQEERETPGLGGLGAILDSDGDGFDLDDVVAMAGKMSGGTESSSSQGGGLGAILGRLLRR
ncbi:MAG: DUF937 domain-containing protein [Acidimicrobiia bacterium]